AGHEREALVSQLKTLQEAAAADQAAFDQRLAAADAERARIEEAARQAAVHAESLTAERTNAAAAAADASDRAEAALRRREALATELKQAREAAAVAEAALHERLAAADAERERLAEAAREAEAQVDGISQERDALALELEQAQQAAVLSQVSVEART